MPAPTASESLARLLDSFSGKLKTKTGATVNAGDSSLLLGVIFRAINRQSKGLVLSEFEEKLTRFWGAFNNNDQELAEYGKLYTEKTVSSKLPDEITRLPLDKSYTWDDFVRDAPDVSSRRTQPSHVEVIDLAKYDLREDDHGSSTGALAATGYGTTIYTNSDPTVTGAKWVNACQIWFQKFHCVKKQDDAIFGPSNEIYWAYASGIGEAPKEHAVTTEYGSVVNGTTKEMNERLFSGKVGKDKCVAVNLECWEADSGDEGWKNKLGEALINVGGLLQESAEYSNNKKAAAVATTIGLITELIGLALTTFKNEDDLVLQRTIILTQPALMALWNKPGHADYWNFDGGSQGFHQLYLRINNEATFGDW